MENPKFRLAIVGGGIAGLVFAIALAQFSDNIQIDLYEAAQEFTEIGAGVGFVLRSWKIMRALSLDKKLKTMVEPFEDDVPRLLFELRKADQSPGISFLELHAPNGNVPFRRSALLEQLAQCLDPKVICLFSKRLVDYDQPRPSGPISLRFQDGTSATCDVLIGADGIHSSTRHKLLKDVAEHTESEEEGKKLLGKLDPVWSGTVSYRAVVPCAKLRAVNPNHRVLTKPVLWMGSNRHIVSMPMARGTLINLAAFVSDPEKEGSDYDVEPHRRFSGGLLEIFHDFEEDVQQLLGCVETSNLWAINTLNPLPICTDGRVALIGDSAHAMAPHQGSGAGQAIEDGYILATILSHPLCTLETVSHVIEVYQDVRLPKANEVLERSRRSGRLYDFLDEKFSDLRTENIPTERLKELADTLVENWEWSWLTDAEADRELAVKLVEERLGA